MGQVEVGLFNRVLLSDVSLKDPTGRELLAARSLSCKIELLPLLRKEVSLRSVSLLDADVRLYRARPGAPANFQFLIDAFSSGKTQKKSRLDLRVNSLIVRRCRVSYDVLSAPATPREFNPSHVAVSALDANVSLKRLTPDSLNLRVRKLAFREKCGLQVKRLTFRFAANRRKGTVEDFILELPDTYVAQERLTADYDARDAETFMQSVVARGELRRSYVATDDIAGLVPALAGLHRKVRFSSDFEITPGLIVLRNAEASTARGDFELRSDVRLHRSEGRWVALEAAVVGLSVKSSLQEALWTAFSGKPLLPVLHKVGDIAFAGRLAYARNRRGLLD